MALNSILCPYNQKIMSGALCFVFWFVSGLAYHCRGNKKTAANKEAFAAVPCNGLDHTLLMIKRFVPCLAERTTLC
jgi:hypothetical protein